MPELSYAAGLTDNIRNNYNIMKDLSGVTKMLPNHRREVIKRFVEEVEKNEITRELLSEWGLRMSHDIVKFTARRLEPETIQFGNGRTYRSNDKPADWSSAAVRNPVLRTVSILNNNSELKNCYIVNDLVKAFVISLVSLVF